MTKVIIHGSKGRMGQMLIACGGKMDGLEIVAGVDEGDALADHIAGCDAVIDFSLHHATAACAALCVEHGKALIIGTTGHTDEGKAEVLNHQSSIPIVWASNYSTGVSTLFWLTRKAAEILGPGYDLEVVEMHHRHKVDAPSGTAATLGEILLQVRDQQKESLRHGREGIVGERTDEEIGMHSLRGGDVVGAGIVHAAIGGAIFPGRTAARTRQAIGRFRRRWKCKWWRGYSRVCGW